MDVAALTETDLQLLEVLMKPAVHGTLLLKLKEICLFNDVFRTFWHKDKTATTGLLMQDHSPYASALANCSLMS